MQKTKCEYCSFDKWGDDPNETIWNGGMELALHKNGTLEVSIDGDYVGEFKVKNCYMCGRKLNEDSDEQN